MSRISSGTMTVAIFAILIGLGGAYTVRQYLSQKPAEAPAPAAPRPPSIPLASVDIEPGRKLTLGDVALYPMTNEMRKKRGIPDDAMMNAQQIVGRIVKAPLKKGNPFTSADLYPEGTGPSVAERLKPGFRAVSVPVNSIGSVAGFAGPGTFVDVVFRTKAQTTSALPETAVTLVEKVEVLAYDAASFPGTLSNLGPANAASQAAMITVAVTPNQANALKAVEGRGELSLALRHPEDETQLEGGVIEKVTLEKLLGMRDSVKPQTMEIYRGGGRQTLTFSNNQVVEDSLGPTGLPIPAVVLKQPERKAPANGSGVGTTATNQEK